MSAATVQSSGPYVPAATATYSNSTSSTGQYLQQQAENHDIYRANHDIYAASSQQSRDQRRAHASPASTTRYNIGGPNDQTTVSLPAHSATTVLPMHNRVVANEFPHDTDLAIPPRTTSQTSPVLSASSSRHAAQQAGGMPELQTQRMRDDLQYTGTSRPDAVSRANGLPPMVREHSEVINRVIVSDPTVDEERMRARIAEAQPLQPSADAQRMGLTSESGGQEDTRGPQRRQDYSKSKRREIQFGEYILGQTLGEGEFGKVKLGWKKDGSSQVAIKLIRRESVAINPTRLPKIYREISILRDLAHPNIVRLHEMVETERHIGIILEYASGGELFDYILNQRYLKDPSARRLFAQLVSGVGYLHKKGIVHRDLKLENLLLDQNKNIIITDFGFANTFDPRDELSPEVEYNLSNRDFVRKYKLDRVDASGMRKGDLMQTSCGSPCYAAPELVVSDSLYTGRKVDVWSCGVILYAMLAGYLPFDDDPANPEGDNINLLYKYITSTPLTFPEYVTPHSRDLLRRILVPDPRKRADLFEVARHSWLTEYHHVVAHVTSSTTNIADISNSTVTVPADELSGMNRSMSVRVPPTATAQRVAPQPSTNDRGEDPRRHMARHTLQAEYVPPQQHTDRMTQQETIARQNMEANAAMSVALSAQKPLPQAPVPSEQPQIAASQSQPIPAIQNVSTHEVPRSSSDGAGILLAAAQPSANQFATRPVTQGSTTSFSGQTRPEYKLPSRGSYGMTAPPTVTTTTATGKVTAPGKNGSGYNISAPQYQQGATNSIGQSMAPPVAPMSAQQQKSHHRRSSTLSSIGEKLFGRSNSVARRNRDEERQKNGRRYPPTAMKMPMSSDPPQPRMSTDSKRSFSFLRRKESTEAAGQEPQVKEKGSRRFSALLPNSMSLKSMMGGNRGEHEDSRTQSPVTAANSSSYVADAQQDRRNQNFSRPQVSGHRSQQSSSDVYGGTGVYQAGSQQQFQHGRENSQSQFAQYANPDGSQSRPSMQQGRTTLTKPRRFNDGYDDHRSGTGAVKRVQDFFRRRGRARADSEYR